MRLVLRPQTCVRHFANTVGFLDNGSPARVADMQPTSEFQRARILDVVNAIDNRSHLENYGGIDNAICT